MKTDLSLNEYEFFSVTGARSHVMAKANRYFEPNDGSNRASNLTRILNHRLGNRIGNQLNVILQIKIKSKIIFKKRFAGQIGLHEMKHKGTFDPSFVNKLH